MGDRMGHGMGIITRAAFAVTVALALATAPAVVPSLATEAYAGSITINKADDINSDVTYNAYLIFSGTVDAGTPNRVSNLAWNDAARPKVVAAIRAVDSSYEDPSSATESAQLAAEKIAENIKVGDVPSSDSTLIVPSGSFAKALAEQLKTLTPVATVTPGTQTSLAQDGYYLFIATPASVGGSETGTSPIFAVVGGSNNVTVTEKTSVPTIDKLLQREGGAWGRATDRGMGDTVRFRITSTLPSNLATFASYNHKVTDTLPAGLTPNAGSIVVRMYADASAAAADVTGTAGTPVTSGTGVSASFSGQTLTMDIADVKALPSVTPASVFVTYYAATVNASLAQGSAGNVNVATLTYTHDPMAAGTGTRDSNATKVYNYKLSLHKQDRANASRALRNAEFTLKLKTDDLTSANNGKYVQADGSLGATAHKFVTDASGNFSVSGLDSGTYVLSEVTAPPSTNSGTYEKVADTEIVIDGNPDKDVMQVLPSEQPGKFSLTAAKGSGGSSDVFVADAVNASGQATGGVDATSGNVGIVVRDVKTILMPLTGQAGIALFVVFGIVVAVVAVKLLVPRRRDEDGDSGE